jgi:hypothetical protein
MADQNTKNSIDGRENNNQLSGQGLPSFGASSTVISDHASGGSHSQATDSAGVIATKRLSIPKLRSLPVSGASSRECSPRSAVSEAPSLATQAMARLAHYRAGPRSFKLDTTPTKGLSTGDVVAFRIRGAYLAATPVSQIGTDPDAVLHTLAPSDVLDLSDRALHIEVIRQGQWIGLRSLIAGDRFLQARRRGAHRVAFFSANLGTWEQWEILDINTLETASWSNSMVTIRNRRMPTCELSVQLVRVGRCVLSPGSTNTPRSLPAPTAAALDEDVAENVNIRRMSGFMLHVSGY